MDYTYENFKNFSSNLYKKDIKEAQEILPIDMKIWCKEMDFIAFCYGYCDKEIKKDNYLDLIKH